MAQIGIESWYKLQVRQNKSIKAALGEKLWSYKTMKAHEETKMPSIKEFMTQQHIKLVHKIQEFFPGMIIPTQRQLGGTHRRLLPQEYHYIRPPD